MKILLSKIKLFFNNHWTLLLVILLSLVFFVSVSVIISLNHQAGFVRHSSPDETANYIFTKLYSQTGEMEIFEKLNLENNDIIHPRSFRSDNGSMKPVSFLGLALTFGKISSLTTYKVIPYLTPFFAALAIIFYFLLVRKIFGQKNALVSTSLLAIFPVFVYYSVRSMFHNVFFVSTLIIGLYFLVISVKSKRKWLPLVHSALGGGFIGLAITARTSELLWLVPALFIIWLVNINKVSLSKLLLILAFVFLAITPTLCWNKILYGSYLFFGYPEINQSIQSISLASGELVKSAATGHFFEKKQLAAKIASDIFHFGFHPQQSLKMLYYYFVRMFAWLFWPAFFGAILFLQDIKKWKRKHWAFFISFVLLSVILILYYGSWEFHDNPDPKQATIGNSYTRYWLPVYLGAIPFFSLFVLRFFKALFSDKKNIEGRQEPSVIKKYLLIFKNKYLSNILIVLVVFFVYLVSINYVLFGSEEGLVYSYYKNKSARMEYEQILSATENNAVIVTQYHDKLLFPERKVIVGLFNDENMNKIYAQLASTTPLYYYNFTFSPKDLEYLNNNRFKNINLKITPIKEIAKDFSLYKLSVVNQQ